MGIYNPLRTLRDTDQQRVISRLRNSDQSRRTSRQHFHGKLNKNDVLLNPQIPQQRRNRIRRREFMQDRKSIIPQAASPIFNQQQSCRRLSMAKAGAKIVTLKEARTLIKVAPQRKKHFHTSYLRQRHKEIKEVTQGR